MQYEIRKTNDNLVEIDAIEAFSTAPILDLSVKKK
jgi:hypothetical protein